MPDAMWCDHHNHDVTIDVCVRCRMLCIHNPGAHESGLWSGMLVVRWGSAAIESFLDSRRVAAHAS